MPEPRSESILPAMSLDEIRHVLRRHRAKMIAAALLGVAGIVILFLTAQRTYRSEARLMVRYVADTSILGSDASGDRVIESSLRGQSIINSEAEIFSSHDLADKVAREVGSAAIIEAAKGNSLLRRLVSHLPLPRLRPVEAGGSGREASLAGLLILNSLTIEIPSRSNVIKLLYDAPDPVLAQDVLRRLIEAYLKKHYEVHRGGDAYEFLAEQTDQLKARLQATEGELRRLRQQAGVVSIEDRKLSLPASLDDLRRQLRDAELSLAVARAGARPAAATVREAASAPPRAAAHASEAEAMLLSGLASLRDRERQLLLTYTADSRPVLNVRSQIAELEKTIERDHPGLDTSELAAQPAAAVPVSPVTGVAGLEARVQTLKAQLQELLNEAQQLDSLETEILQLERKKQLEESNYLYFSRSLEQARIDDALSTSKISNISIVQPATLPVLALRSRLPQAATLILVLALCGGVGVAMLSERLRASAVHGPSDLPARLSEPMLVSVPYVPRRGLLLVNPRGGWSAVLPAVPRRAAWRLRRTDWRIHDDQAMCFGAMRERLTALPGRKPGRPCLVGVAAGAKSGAVGTVAAGLALALARGSVGRVLLADARLEERGLHLLLAARAAAAVLRRGARGARDAAQSNLDVLVAARKSAGSSPNPVGNDLPEVIRDMRGSRYEFIVVELPPIVESGSALRMASSLDGLFFVLEAEATRSDDGLRMRDLLDEARVEVLGVVLANRRPEGPARAPAGASASSRPG